MIAVALGLRLVVAPVAPVGPATADPMPPDAVSPDAAPIEPAPTEVTPAEVTPTTVTPPEVAPTETPEVSGASPEGDPGNEAPAPLPETPPERPAPSGPRGAVGGQGYTPLPAEPPPVDPATVARGPWRGRWFLDIALGLSVPLGGAPPGAGGVISGIGGATFGARLHPVVAVGTGLATFVHDAATRDAVDADGQAVRAVGLGRITAFEVGLVRLYVPTPRRIQPRFDAAVLLGPCRPPFGGRRRLAAGLRAGAGVDFWLGPTFTLALEASYRLLAIQGNVGHGLQTTLGMGIHW